MFVYMTYTHPDVAYHTVEGPFETLEEVKTHANELVNDLDYPDQDLDWNPDGLFAQGAGNRFDTCVYVHKLKDCVRKGEEEIKNEKN